MSDIFLDEQPPEALQASTDSLEKLVSLYHQAFGFSFKQILCHSRFIAPHTHGPN
jgi:hypothetical protein